MRPVLLRILSAVAILPSLGFAATALALPFSYSLTVQYVSPNPADVPPLVISGSGASVAGSAGAFTLPLGSVSGNASVVGGPAVAPVVAGLDLNASSGTGSFAPGSPFGGTMAVGGTLTQFWFSVAPGNGVVLPLDVAGVGGSVPYSSPVGFSGTITGSPWTTGSISVPPGVIGDPALTAAGLDARDANGIGSIRLVTWFQVSVANISTLSGPLPGTATLNLTFVPEPGTAMLLAAGVLGLSALRRSANGRESATTAT
jgi:hypothetical protein